MLQMHNNPPEPSFHSSSLVPDVITITIGLIKLLLRKRLRAILG